MSLVVWLPLLGDTHNQGVSGISLTGKPDSWVDGKLGKCAHFVGSLDNVIYNNTSDFNYTDNFSYAFWIKPNYTSGSTQYAFTVGRADMGGYGYSCNVASATQINVRFGSVLIAVTGCNSGTWYHIAVTISNNKIKTYKDGVLFNTSDVGTIPTYSDGRGLGVGCFHYASNVYPYYGDLCDFRIYDHALSPKEIKLLSQGLVAHYTLDGSGTGGANLYTGTRDFSGTWVNSGNWTTDTNEYFNGFTVKTRSATWGGLAQNITATQNDIFTISFYAKAEVGANVQSVHRSSLGNVTTGLTILGGNFTSGTIWIPTDGSITSWKYCWATVRIDSADITYLQWRIENSVANKSIWVTRFKLEKGNKATAWLPNINDIEYSLMGYDDTTVYDSSGYNHHGSPLGTLAIDDDTARYSISTVFDGSSSGVLLENLTLSPVINSDITYSFWIKPNGESGARSVYFGSFSSTSWSIEKDTSNLLRLYWNGSPDEHCTGATITDGEWQHICITKNGTSDVKVYINGVQKWTSTATHSTLTFPTTYRIGRDTRSNDGTPYKGLMSDFRIYATALSAEDVLALYNTLESIANNGTVITQGEFVEV